MLCSLRLASPWGVIGFAVLAIVILATFKRNRTVTLVLGCAAILSSLAALYCLAAPLAPRIAFGAMVIDGQSVLFITIILLSSLAILLVAHGFLLDVKEPQEEFLLALLMGTMGAMTVCAADHFALFFMGLETMSISMYLMIAYGKNRYFGIEAAIKYLIQASIAAAFLLFGMALLYAETGFLEMSKIASALSCGAAISPLSSIGLIMMLVGIGYKLALVPFHFWAPDTYQGAPTPTTMFIVTISKTAVFAFLLRFYFGFGEHPVVTLKLALWTMAIASMFIGNLLALFQQNMKRILAYSSVAHVGYFLSGMLCGAFGGFAAVFYLAVYMISSLCALGAISLLKAKADDPSVSDIRGLIFIRPFLASALAISFLSFAGLPLLAGFFGKIWIVTAAIKLNAWPLAISVMAASLIGIFYYLRIVGALFQKRAGLASGSDFTARNKFLPVLFKQPGYIVVALSALLIVYVGVFPAHLFEIIHSIMMK
jgi:NADH-quinone oxidoreductase subunit N